MEWVKIHGCYYSESLASKLLPHCYLYVLHAAAGILILAIFGVSGSFL
jgi:hypothetical protein